ncbi:polyketide synthase [Gordonia sp. ABSL1-1]|uniref:beta-ketoacyl [acyl carrier protein] synthase domain-containing protein n=1 Tax=Gordonia sp. ABSL1-1 TaxID=3053923 RepID=UPI0025743E32|nr:polyketide synthase [Gordonia sp. ABSL1-1]MDL9937478.1 polyketide synthase [Gordonia sp. ABSL1-1]
MTAVAPIGEAAALADDPIVVVGMSVEAPGGIDTPAAYWSALTEGRDLIGPFPRDRGWDVDELLGLSARHGWGQVADAGGFLDKATEFDPLFFGISPREAVAMDPQQRVMLRTAWRAVENAGINPRSLAGQEVGVYVGGSAMEYGPRAAEVNEYSGYRAAGSALGAMAGRISHCMQLTGPCMTVDTACASSLTALDLAVKALRDDDAQLALVGGVCVMGSPAAFYEFSKNNALAAGGQCRPYSSEADGTLWGEGAGLIVLERRSRALAADRRIYGEILATGVNHNGGGAGIALPSAAAQQRLIERVVQRAGIAPEHVDLIEGHGTGTAVGDPLELEALSGVYGAARRNAPAAVGSVKSNLGHAQAASGMLGLIKVLLCGLHGQIAPTRHAQQPSDSVDWTDVGLRLPAAVEDWPDRDGVRHAAVSSFGIAGTNAHAIIAMPTETSDNNA